MLTACTGAQNDTSAGDDLFTSETQFYSFQRLLPLPVSTTPGDTLYTSEIWGIDMVEILADGRAITGKTSFILLDDLNIGPLTVQSGTFIYSVNLSQMLFGKFSSPLSYELVEYEIPEDAKILEIRYRLVPHDSDPAPRVYTMKAHRIG